MTGLTSAPVRADVAASWIAICERAVVHPDRGIAAIANGDQIAIFRLSAINGEPEEWCAVSHVDPFSGVAVIARGLVGSFGEGLLSVPTVASPLHKQRFNLRSGYCLDDADARLKTYGVRVTDGIVEVKM